MKKNDKLKIKIEKDAKKDFTKKSKDGMNILYPKFNAKVEFDKVKMEFSDYDSHKRISMDFAESFRKLPANRVEYGEDFSTADGRMLILRYKLDNRGNQVITSVEAF